MTVTTTKLYAPQGSGILQEAIELVPCSRTKATHLVISYKKRIKYIISLDNGIRKLRKTIAAYNNKLKLLLSLLPFIPTPILILAGIGHYAQIRIHKDIQCHVPENYLWNILVGTYDEAQKIVLQCFPPTLDDCIYIKVGNAGSNEQMLREIRFLRTIRQYKKFSTPELIDSVMMHASCIFNILITKEFVGLKISPRFTEEIYQITREIAGEPTIIDGKPYEFTHGDFAPWNIRRTGDSYIVFDWEHCNLRPMGYDAIYFIIMTEIALHQRRFDEAFSIAENKLRLFHPEIKFDKGLIRQEFIKTTKSLQF